MKNSNRSSMFQEIMDQFEVAHSSVMNRWSEAMDLNKLLHSADNIVLLGTGASLNACYGVKDAAMKYLHKIPHVVEMAQAAYITPTLTEKTVCFLVSQSGNSKETKEGVEFIKKTAAITVAITNNENSYLARNCNRKMLLLAGDEVSSATKTCTISILLLYMIIAAHNEKAVAEICRVPSLIAEALDSLPEIVKSIAEELKDSGALYIATLGRLFSVARQGALLIKEKDFILAEGMSISELRHGTVEAVYQNMPILILAVGADVDDSIEHSAYFSKHVGAKVYLVTDIEVDQEKAACHQNIVIANSTDEVFCSICPAIFFQLLSERIADLNDYNIDGFRYLSKVIETY